MMIDTGGSNWVAIVAALIVGSRSFLVVYKNKQTNKTQQSPAVYGTWLGVRNLLDSLCEIILQCFSFYVLLTLVHK